MLATCLNCIPGRASSKFILNDYPVATSRFPCTKVIDIAMLAMFSFMNTHSFTMSNFLCMILLVVSGTQRKFVANAVVTAGATNKKKKK